MTTVVANLATYVNCTLIFLASGSTAIFQSNITEKELDRNTLAEYGWGEGRESEEHFTTRYQLDLLRSSLSYKRHRNEVQLEAYHDRLLLENVTLFYNTIKK